MLKSLNRLPFYTLSFSVLKHPTVLLLVYNMMELRNFTHCELSAYEINWEGWIFMQVENHNFIYLLKSNQLKLRSLQDIEDAILTNTKGTISLSDPNDSILYRVVYSEKIRKAVRIFPFNFIIIMIRVGLACVFEF